MGRGGQGQQGTGQHGCAGSAAAAAAVAGRLSRLGRRRPPHLLHQALHFGLVKGLAHGVHEAPHVVGAVLKHQEHRVELGACRAEQGRAGQGCVPGVGAAGRQQGWKPGPPLPGPGRSVLAPRQAAMPRLTPPTGDDPLQGNQVWVRARLQHPQLAHRRHRHACGAGRGGPQGEGSAALPHGTALPLPQRTHTPIHPPSRSRSIRSFLRATSSPVRLSRAISAAEAQG